VDLKPRDAEGTTMALRVGDPVGDFTFLRADGTPLRLSDVRQQPAGRPLLLIFLRHLA
jgi:hypothetical protein